MNILIFSIFLISTILLVIYFWNANKRKDLKLLIIFGLFIGIVSVIICKFKNHCFGASTPIDIKTQNLTKQNLKIYAITFWEDYGNGNGNYVTYNSELQPNETSEFCIDSDGGKFWLIAKNEQNNIVYLEETQNEKVEFKITDIQTKETEKTKLAKYLTFKTDQSINLEKNLLWVNLVLIGILVLNLIGVKKYGS